MGQPRRRLKSKRRLGQRGLRAEKALFFAAKQTGLDQVLEPLCIDVVLDAKWEVGVAYPWPSAQVFGAAVVELWEGAKSSGAAAAVFSGGRGRNSSDESSSSPFSSTSSSSSSAARRTRRDKPRRRLRSKRRLGQRGVRAESSRERGQHLRSRGCGSQLRGQQLWPSGAAAAGCGSQLRGQQPPALRAGGWAEGRV